MHTEDGNLFAGIAKRSHDEQVTALLAKPGLKIERIVSTGQATPSGSWLVQEQAEWVLLISGAAAVMLEGEASSRQLNPGDYLTIPTRRRHRVAWTEQNEPTVWLAVHFSDVSVSDDC